MPGEVEGTCTVLEFYNAGVSGSRARPNDPPGVLLRRIEEFVARAAAPALIEPGNLPYILDEGHFTLKETPNGVLVEAWDQERNLARRLVRVIHASTHRMQLEIIRFGGKKGTVEIADLNHGRGAGAIVRASRGVLRERLRIMAARQFPGWHLRELSVGADLENTLSPAQARGLMTKGELRWAVCAAPRSSADEALTNGLIWLDYLRRRESPATIEGIALFLPRGTEMQARQRISCLHRIATRYRLYAYEDEGGEAPVDLFDTGNLDTRVEPAPTSLQNEAGSLPAWIRRLADLPDVEAIPLRQGEWSLRVRGLEFARIQQGEVWAGLDRKQRVSGAEPVEALAQELASLRCLPPPDSRHPWFRRNPEAWLESVVRNNLQVLDAALDPTEVHGQVPSIGGAERGVLDLLAIDFTGRLAVIELKASEDPGLPLQALDYWWRVASHAKRGDFTAQGYFRGREILPLSPRLLLVSPALAFHSTTETILSFCSPDIEVERIGLGVEWQSNPQVVLRAKGAQRPDAYRDC